MNRLQKKCFIASAGTHLLMLVILFVGPAFLSSKSPKIDDMPIIDFIPPRTVDAAVAPNPGGAPVQRQQQRQQSVAVQPPSAPESKPPAPQKDPDPPKVAEKKDTDSLEIKPQKRRLPQVSTTPTTRRSTTKEKQTEKSDNREREVADNRRRATAAAFAQATENLDKASSGVTSIRVGDGNGMGTGAAYANFFQVVKSVYTRAWNVPDGASDGAVISVSVTIARNGDVVSSRITRRSGDSIADTSVELLLDRVRYVAPLPEDSKEDQRIVKIDFSVRAAKRLLG